MKENNNEIRSSSHSKYRCQYPSKARTFGEVAEEWYEVEVASSGTSESNKKNYSMLLI